MQQYEVPYLGPVFRLEPGDDARGIEQTLASDARIAYDTEGSGLEVYKPDFEHRLSQFGTANFAFTWDPDELPQLDRLCTTTRPVWYFNADFDTRVIDKHRGIKLEETWPYVLDASILARLIDPRSDKQGGIGHGLEAQCEERLGLGAKGATKSAMLTAGKGYGLKSEAAMWAGIPRIDPSYNMYAGQDVMSTVRLGEHLEQGIEYYDLKDVADFEHILQYCISTIIRRGWKIDRPYAEKAIATMLATFKEEDAKLSGMGVRPTKSSGLHVTSRAGLIDRFLELGVTFTEPSDSAVKKRMTEKEIAEAKAWKLDEDVLLAISSKKQDEAAELARAVLKAKKPYKAAGTIQGYLDAADPDDRVHANINPLGTVTGRMSSSSPNLQNPDRDIEEVRGTFVAEPDEVLISVDYSGVEWRVAAGVTDDAAMRAAFAKGLDPHNMVAEMIHGDAWRFGSEYDQKVMRQESKTRGLAKLYGQWYKNAAKAEGIPEEEMKAVHDAIDELFPGIKSKVRELEREIDGPTRMTLATGRHVIIDRGYKALNYLCQGPARDLLAYAVVRLFEAGLGQHICMLVHDEVVLSVPASQADEYLRRVTEIMESEFLGVKIESDGNELGERWRKP